ncbi:MAG: hypothetical protein H6720_03075 [Sandaracinus sp.]|nr:hypothetical protein [Sandaracinus sp.]
MFPSASRPPNATTTSLADAALQARLRHVEAQIDELPKWTARLVALEDDARFDALGTRLDALESNLQSTLARVDAAVAALAPLIERVSELERARDARRERLDRAMDLATAAHEAMRGAEARGRDHDARTAELERAHRLLTERVATQEGAARDDVGRAEAVATLEARLVELERQSDSALRGRVAAMEARLVSLVARFADIAAREGGRPSAMPPPPTAASGPAPDDLDARIAAAVRRELAGARPATREEEGDLRRVKGIGPAFADRLRAHGIPDVGTLAALDDARLPDLVESLGVPVAKLRKWRDAAKKV